MKRTIKVEPMVKTAYRQSSPEVGGPTTDAMLCSVCQDRSGCCAVPVPAISLRDERVSRYCDYCGLLLVSVTHGWTGLREGDDGDEGDEGDAEYAIRCATLADYDVYR